MIPRSIDVQKFIQQLFTPQQFEEYGGILGPVEKNGWTNRFSSFYTEIPPNAYNVSPGDKAPEYYVLGYAVNGSPLWNQPPVITEFIGPEGQVYSLPVPQPASSIPPPIGPLEPPVPPVPEIYSVTTTPATAAPLQQIYSAVDVFNPTQPSETVYWRYSGSGVTPQLFTDGQLTGSITLVNGGGGWSSTIDWPVPQAISVKVSIYRDATFGVALAHTRFTLNPSSYTLTSDKTSVTGGDAFTITVNSQNVPNGATLYYRYSGVDASYFSGGQLEGQVILNSNTGQFGATMEADVPKGGKFTVSLYEDAARTRRVGNALDIKVVGTPTYSLTSSPTNLSENRTVTNRAQTANVPTGTTLYWSYDGVTADFFKDGAITGSIKVDSSGLGTWQSVVSGIITGDATVTVKLFTDSARTNQVGNSSTFTITRTLIPSYTLVSNPKTLAGGNTLTNTLTTTNVQDGTSLYWEYSGSGLDASYFTNNLLKANIVVNNNKASWSSTLESDVPDAVTMAIKLYPNSSKVTVLASQSVNIQRTLEPTYKVTVNPGTVTDGQSFTSTVSVTDVPSGTTLYWDYTGVGLTGAWFTDGKTSGSVTVQVGSASWSSTTTNPVPAGEDVSINLYTDSNRTNKVASTALRINKTPVVSYSWTVAPTSVTDGSTFAFTITTNIPPKVNEILYYKLTGIDEDYLASSSPGINGSFNFPAGQTQITSPTFTMANPLPDNATMQASLYSDSSRKQGIATILTIPVTKTAVPTYAVSISPSPALAGNTITSTVTTTNLAAGTTLYWSYTGTNITPLFFTNGLLTGSVAIDENGSGNFSSTLTDPLPEDTTLIVNIFSDSNKTKLVANKGVAISNLSPTFSLGSQPVELKDGTTLTNTVTTTHAPDNTPIYWEYSSESGISPSFFKDGRVSGQVSVKDAKASWTSTLKPYVGPDEAMTVSLYADSSRSFQIGNTTEVSLIFEPLPDGYSLRTNFPVAPVGSKIDFTLEFPAPFGGLGKTIYWAMEGLDYGDPLFVDDVVEGSVFVGGGKTSVTVSKTLRDTLPYGAIGQFRFSEKEGGETPYTVPLVVNVAPAALENGVYLNTAGLNDGDALSVHVKDSSRTSTTLHWKMSGTATASFFKGNTLTGSVALDSNGDGFFDIIAATPLPDTDIHDVTLIFYSDAGFTSPIYNPSGYHFFIRQTDGSSPFFRVGSDLDQYYDLGGYWEEVDGTAGPNNVGTNPNLNMNKVLEVNSDIDELLLRVRAAYQATSKRLWNLDALQSSAGQFMGSPVIGASWNSNSGNEWGKDGDANGPTKAKNCCYHAKNTFKPHRFIVSIGGDENEGGDIYDGGTLIGGFSSVVNGTATEIENAAIDAANLVKAAGANGLEISMWFDRNQTIDPTNYNTFFQKVRSKLNLIDPKYTLHLAVNARKDDSAADAGNQGVFVGAVQDSFTTVTIKNYNSPSKYGQNPEDITAAYTAFYHPSNIFWSLREVDNYAANGVPVSKIGINVSGQGLPSGVLPVSTDVAPYGDIIRGMNADNQPNNDAVLGRFNGSVTTGGSSVSGFWGFDSPSVICQKAQSAINLGLSNICLWDFSGDYYNPTTSDFSAIESASRSNDALIRAVRKALSASVFATDFILVTTPHDLKENAILRNSVEVSSGHSGGKTYWYQYETIVFNETTGAEEWQAIDAANFTDPVKGSFQFSTEKYFWTSTVAATISVSLDFRVAIYDSEPPATVPLDTIPLAIGEASLKKTLTPQYSVNCAPTSVNDGDKFTTTIQGVNASEGDTVYWAFRGDNVTSDFFAGGATQGSVTLDAALKASFVTQMAKVIPADAIIDVDISLTQGGAIEAKAQVTAHKSTPETPVYTIECNNYWAYPGDLVTFTIYHKNSTVHPPIYWKIEGFNPANFLKSPSSLEGQVTFTPGGEGTFGMSVKESLPNGCVWKASIYSDAARTQLLATPISGTILQTLANQEPYVTVNASAINVHQTVTYEIYDPDANDGDTVYVTATGTGIDQHLINEAPEKALSFSSHHAYWVLSTVSDFPSTDAFYEVTFTAYSDAAHTSQYKNIVPMHLSLHESETVAEPTLGAYTFINDWVTAGSLQPTVTPSEDDRHPDVIEIASYGLNQLDEFYLIGDVRPWTDGKLYHWPQDSLPPDNTGLILNGNGTDWGTQDLGEAEKYLKGWYLLKSNIESIFNYTPPKALVLTIGGPGVGDKLAEVGSNNTTALKFADQVFTLATLCQANAVDIQYVPPKGTLFASHNLKNLLSTLRAKFTKENSNKKIYFSTYPTDATDSNRVAETCSEVEPYVDRINIITTQQFSQYGQDYIDIPNQPSGVPWAHTGVAQCVLDMSRIIKVGVPPKKLGMAFAYYGHAAIVDTSFDLAQKFSYQQNFRADKGGVGTGDLPLGRYLRSINNTMTPVSLDTTTTVAQKIQAIRNMGIGHIFGMEITKDYWVQYASNLAAGNSRVGMALTRAAKIAISGVENPDVIATYKVTCTPSSVSDGESFVTNIETTNLATGTEIFWTFTGTGVTSDLFSGGATSGSVSIDSSGKASFTTKMANVLPNNASLVVSIMSSEGGAVRDTANVTVTKTSPVQVTYGMTVDKAWAMENEDIFIYIEDTSPDGSGGSATLYWALTGADANTFFTDGTSQGAITLSNGKASIQKTIRSGLANGCVYKVSLYLDAGYNDLITTTSAVIVQGTYGVSSSDGGFTDAYPSAAGPSNIITWRTRYKAPSDAEIVLNLEGSAIDKRIIENDLAVDIFADSDGFATHQWVLPSNFPTDDPTYQLKIISRLKTQGKLGTTLTPFDNDMQITLHEATPNEALKYTGKATLSSWLNAGAIHEPVNQQPSYSSILSHGIPAIDELHIFGEIYIHTDGKLYHTSSGTFDGNSAILNPQQTNWNPYENASEGPWSIKRVSEQRTRDIPNKGYGVVCGGHQYSNGLAAAGANNTIARRTAEQLINFAVVANASTIVIDYEPLDAQGQAVAMDPAACARICSEIRDLLTSSQSTKKLELLLPPSTDDADTFKRINTAFLCKDSVDAIGIKTIDNPSSYGQPNLDNAPFNNHTGVPQSVLDIKRFIDAGVPASKLKMDIATFGLKKDDPFGSPARGFGDLFSNGNSSGDWPLGRLNTTSGDWYSLDTLATLTQKVVAARNLGLAGVYSGGITDDYNSSDLTPPPGNSRELMAQTRAVRLAIDGGTVVPFTPAGLAFGVDNQWTLPGETLTFTALDVDSKKEGGGVYWELEGFNPDDILDGDTSMSGTATVTNGAATFSKTVKGSISTGAVYKATIYEDSTKTKQLAPAVSATVLQTAQNNTPPYVTVNPAAAITHQLITYKLHLPDISDGTNIYLKATGSAVDNNLIVGDTSTTVQLQNSSAIWQFSTSGDFPASSPTYELKIDAYTDSGFTNQVPKTSTQYVTLHETNVADEVKVGAYVDIYQWRNHDPNLVPNAPSPTVDDIGSDGFPQLDEFALLAEIQLYSDGKLYCSANRPPVFDSNSLVLNGDASDWNPVEDVNAGPKLLKDANARIQPFNPRKYTISVGGYALSNYMTDAGSTNALATTSAEQLFRMATLSNAQAIDLDYEPLDGNGVAVPLEPENMARICQKLREKIELENSPLQITLTLVPSLDDADSLKRIATAVACESYVDRINVMTYDNPSYYGQTPFEDGTPFQNHTGVYQSVLDVVRFINAGVPSQKLGMGYALYGRLNSTPFSDAGTSYYDTVHGVGTGDFPLGRADYSGGWRGMDSTTTLTQKVMAARMLGLDYVFGWEITQDDWRGGGTGGNTRANMALTKAARLSSYGFERS